MEIRISTLGSTALSSLRISHHTESLRKKSSRLDFSDLMSQLNILSFCEPVSAPLLHYVRYVCIIYVGNRSTPYLLSKRHLPDSGPHVCRELTPLSTEIRRGGLLVIQGQSHQPLVCKLKLPHIHFSSTTDDEVGYSTTLSISVQGSSQTVYSALCILSYIGVRWQQFFCCSPTQSR